MKFSMWKFLWGISVFASTFSGTAFSYPSTITHYTQCRACHVSPSGGLAGPLNDYGRGMSEAFMATFSRKNEAREFYWASAKGLDLGGDSRMMSITRQGQTDAFPMLADIELAAHVDRFFFDASIGVYGREGELESRRHFVGFETKLGRSLLNIRAGLFHPAYGIMDSNHSLWIKRRIGLGRGTEHYGIEGYYSHKKLWQLFVGYGLKEFNFKTTNDGMYAARPKSFQRGTLRLSLTAFKRFELGMSAMKNVDQHTVGVFSRMSPLKNTYAILEYDHKLEAKEGIAYVRTGVFVYRGIDLYGAFEAAFTDITESQSTLGIHWMIRPRMELDLSITKKEEIFTQTMGVHFWL